MRNRNKNLFLPRLILAGFFILTFFSINVLITNPLNHYGGCHSYNIINYICFFKEFFYFFHVSWPNI